MSRRSIACGMMSQYCVCVVSAPNTCCHLHVPSDQVSVIGHSLGSIIAHDILMAQPVRGETELAEGAVSKGIPLLR